MRQHKGYALRRRYGRAKGPHYALIPKGTFKRTSTMTPGEINKERAKLRALSSKINDAMIAAGRGHETSSETHRKSPADDDLTLAWHAVSQRLGDLHNEAEARMGQRWYGELPKDARRKGW